MTPSKTELGKFIRRQRLALGLSQTELSALVGLKQTSISQLEIGKSRFLKEELLVKLSFALKCDSEELRSLIPKMPPVTTPRTELAKLIVNRRTELGLSQSQLRKKLGFSRDVVRLETKAIRLNYATAEKLAALLELDISVFLPFLNLWKKKTTNKFGELVRRKRLMLGITLRQLSNMVGVSYQYLSFLETGKYVVSADSLIIEKLSEALDISLEELKEKAKSDLKNRCKVKPKRLGERGISFVEAVLGDC
jgi:transcriptional regulator with XRE-family HTH domain